MPESNKEIFPSFNGTMGAMFPNKTQPLDALRKDHNMTPDLLQIMGERRGQCRGERINCRPSGQGSLWKPQPGDLPTAADRAARGAKPDPFRTPAGFCPDLFPSQEEPRA